MITKANTATIIRSEPNYLKSEGGSTVGTKSHIQKSRHAAIGRRGMSKRGNKYPNREVETTAIKTQDKGDKARPEKRNRKK